MSGVKMQQKIEGGKMKNNINRFWHSKLMTVTIFVFLAIPGFFLFFFSSFIIIISLISGENQFGPNFPLLLYSPLPPVGLFLVLVGTRKLKEWKYVFVFLSLPIGLFVGANLGMVILFMFIFSFLTYYFVKNHYIKNKNSSQTKGSNDMT